MQRFSEHAKTIHNRSCNVIKWDEDFLDNSDLSCAKSQVLTVCINKAKKFFQPQEWVKLPAFLWLFFIYI